MPKPLLATASSFHEDAPDFPAPTKYQIYCADARQQILTFPNNVFASVITSPPYWGLRTYGHPNELGGESDLSLYLKNLVELFREIKRTLKDDGVMWLVMGDAYTSGNRKYRATDKKFGPRAMTSRPKTPLGLKTKDLIGLPWRLAFALQEDGWYLRTDVVWSKPNPLPESVKDRPHRSHEFVFMLTKAKDYFFDREAFAHPELGDGKFGRSVWTVSVGQRQSSHPAAFPLELIMPCIISTTRPGDIVLDPFAGSASVGLSALRVGRRFVGIEIVPEFASGADIALQKLVSQNTIRVVK